MASYQGAAARRRGRAGAWPFSILASLALATGLAAGCGDHHPEVVPVSGLATRQGVPLANVHINFEPEEGRPSWAVTDANGRFTCEYTREQKGARAGKHSVWLVYRPQSPQEEMEYLSGNLRLSPEVLAAIARYGSKPTGLAVDIQAAQTNLELKFD